MPQVQPRCYQRNLRCYGINENECFHWHLADDQGWRIEMKNHPKLNKADGLVYSRGNQKYR
jgi:hexosaminidase